jgi:hypothetical protein
MLWAIKKAEETPLFLLVTENILETIVAFSRMAVEHNVSVTSCSMQS